MRSSNSAISVEANHRCSTEMVHSFSFQQPWKPEVLLSEFERWESRYAGADYAFGKEPNYFLASCKGLLPKSGRVLAVADGEGRNGVWLAENGLDVVSIDFSPTALRKARG